MAHHGPYHGNRRLRGSYSLGCSYGLAAVVSMMIWAAVIAAVLALT